MVDTEVREGALFLGVALLSAVALVVFLMDIGELKALITWLGLKEVAKWMILR